MYVMCSIYIIYQTWFTYNQILLYWEFYDPVYSRAISDTAKYWMSAET
jgi:hypothetical protein